MKNTLPTLGCFVFLSIVLVGCNSQNYEGEKRYPLSGKVTYNGEPVDRGNISFLPMNPDSQRVAGGKIEDGAYSFEEEYGANAGQYKVEIRWQKKTGDTFTDAFGNVDDVRVEAIPAEFNTATTLTADIGAGKTYDFDLESDKKARKARQQVNPDENNPRKR
ncbi:MAG: hypothetical protein IT422_13660 [Pirellulaceae bacterium]|nr:hypothetical protein [Pirellulaceae bacterium]